MKIEPEQLTPPWKLHRGQPQQTCLSNSQPGDVIDDDGDDDGDEDDDDDDDHGDDEEEDKYTPTYLSQRARQDWRCWQRDRLCSRSCRAGRPVVIMMIMIVIMMVTIIIRIMIVTIGATGSPPFKVVFGGDWDAIRQQGRGNDYEQIIFRTSEGWNDDKSRNGWISNQLPCLDRPEMCKDIHLKGLDNPEVWYMHYGEVEKH